MPTLVVILLLVVGLGLEAAAVVIALQLCGPLGLVLVTVGNLGSVLLAIGIFEGAPRVLVMMMGGHAGGG